MDLNGIVEESGAMFRSLLGEDIELATRLSRPLGQVMADPGQMHQVLMNLLANARDAMPDGGRVTIETRNVAVASGNLAEHPEATPGSCVLLLVSDTGVGIDEEVRAHLFEPFFTTKGLGKGTGLGLSTVYGIVKQSRGWICVNSEVGKGSTFKIYLPRIDTAHAAAEEEPQAVTARGNRETVLLVEDQKEVRGLATAILESLGYLRFERGRWTGGAGAGSGARGAYPPGADGCGSPWHEWQATGGAIEAPAPRDGRFIHVRLFARCDCAPRSARSRSRLHPQAVLAKRSGDEGPRGTGRVVFHYVIGYVRRNCYRPWRHGERLSV